MQWGYIDRRGAWAIPPAFKDEPQPFSQGLAAVWVDNGVGYVDRRSAGDVVAPAPATIARHSRRASACFEENERWASWTRAEEFIIPARFESVGRFAEGAPSRAARACRRLYRSRRQHGYPEQFDSAYGFAGGRASGRGMTACTAFIDHGGKPVFSLDGYYPAEAFSTVSRWLRSPTHNAPRRSAMLTPPASVCHSAAVCLRHLVLQRPCLRRRLRRQRLHRHHRRGGVGFAGRTAVPRRAGGEPVERRCHHGAPAATLVR
ncbi:MAG: WG repeat-containing protein [Candidatus Binatia bacterium]